MKREKIKIVVIGGTGFVGKKLVNRLPQQGHEAMPASPSSGVNTVTSEGLIEALEDAQVVIDVADAPSWEDKAALDFFETSTQNLLAAESAAGVKHHVALSMVGIDRLLANGYMRAKMTQELLIESSKIPYTIVRATQFFDLVHFIADSATNGATVRLSSVLMQPIGSVDVASALAKIALGEPVNGIIEIAGPAQIRRDELVRQFLSATGDVREVITDANACYLGLDLNDQSLLPGPNHRLGPTHFAQWLWHSTSEKEFDKAA